MTTIQRSFFTVIAVVFALSSTASLKNTTSAQSNSARELSGLWEAKRRFGPDVKGTLFIRQNGG